MVIGIFYTDTVALGTFGLGVVLLGAAVMANRSGVRSSGVYFVIGLLVWFAFLKSGVHATLAAVLMAFTIPSRTRIDLDGLVGELDVALHRVPLTPLGPPAFLTADQQLLLSEMEQTVDGAVPPLQRLERRLLPWVTFFVLPVFALANAGVVLGAAGGHGASLAHPVALGVIAGLLIGKPLGSFGFAWLAVKLGWADLPEGVTFGHIAAVGLLAGIGFTMALFVGRLAFVDPALVDTAKLGILVASAVTGVAGYLLLRKQLR